MRNFTMAISSIPLLLACDEGVTPGVVSAGQPPAPETPGQLDDDTPTEDPTTPADPALLEVKGRITAPLQASAEPLEVGVLWLNVLDDNATVLVNVAAVDAVGSVLPASFDASLIAPPPDAMLGATLDSWSEGGATERPVDPSRVAFGFVVVAPAGTIANLPESTTLGEFIAASNAAPGPLLESFTLVSSYAVRYVEGAEAEGIVLRDIAGAPYALKDFTLIDLGAWARGVDNAVCRDRRLGEGWESPEVKACIESNAERIAAGEAAAAACASACPEQDTGEFDRCRWDCMTQGDTRGNVENECLFAWGQAQTEATEALCGPQPDFAESDFRSARRLEAGEELTLTPGVGDIRAALTVGGFSLLF
jgi:hypothetical protein